MQMETKQKKRQATKDEKTLHLYSKLLEYYEMFKERFWEANFSWIASKTNLPKGKVKKYLRWQRKLLDIWEMWIIMFYLTNYDHSMKARKHVNKWTTVLRDKKKCKKCKRIMKHELLRYLWLLLLTILLGGFVLLFLFVFWTGNAY